MMEWLRDFVAWCRDALCCCSWDIRVWLDDEDE